MSSAMGMNLPVLLFLNLRTEVDEPVISCVASWISVSVISCLMFLMTTEFVALSRAEAGGCGVMLLPPKESLGQGCSAKL